MTDPVVRADRLVKSYSGRRVVDEISFEIAHGEVFALLGPNGAGKTTSIEILEGFRVADGGKATVFGKDPRRQRAEVMQLVGLMLQEVGLYPGLRVGEILRLFHSYYVAPRDVEEVLGIVDLEARINDKIRSLSGGEKQRLSLALALIGDPRLLFLDEPTTGMDPIARARTWAYLEQLNAQGVTIVLASHALQEVEELADRVAIIDQGAVRAAGSLDDLLSARPRVEFATDRPLDPSILESVDLIELGESRYLVEGITEVSDIRKLTEWVVAQGRTVVELHPKHATLEEIYFGLISQSE